MEVWAHTFNLSIKTTRSPSHKIQDIDYALEEQQEHPTFTSPAR